MFLACSLPQIIMCGWRQANSARPLRGEETGRRRGACFLCALPAEAPRPGAGRVRQEWSCRLHPFAPCSEPGAWPCPKMSLLLGLGTLPLARASSLPSGPLLAASWEADRKKGLRTDRDLHARGVALHLLVGSLRLALQITTSSLIYLLGFECLLILALLTVSVPELLSR